MEIKVISREKSGVAGRFTVCGLPTHRSTFEFNDRQCVLELTLNGEYIITPRGLYSMLPDFSQEPLHAQSMNYQVILKRSSPAIAEFQIFRLRDAPSLNETHLSKLNISVDVFKQFTTDYPSKIASYLEADMLPAGVAKFLMQAKKCTSN
jgi:hypothetical protein